MRAANLAKIAAQAEILRFRAIAGRQGSRAGMGAVAAVFAVCILALIEVLGWQVLRLYVEALDATLILLCVNLLLTLIFDLLAGRSKPSRAEREALELRRRAINELRSSFFLATLVPLIRGKLTSARWPEIEDQLLQGRYQPQPVRRVQIPKPAGGARDRASA